MSNSSLIVGLDIGTDSVKAVVADASVNEIQVIGAVKEKNKGMRQGKIVDIDQTANAISSALKNVEQKTNSKIYRVVTGIPVGMLQLETSTGLINIGEDGREVSDQDVKRVLELAIKQAVKSGREAIAFLPSRFLLDGKTDVDDPRKMIAHSLEVHGILLTAPTGDLHNIKKAIERAGYQNNFFIPTPLAIASVALDEGERTFGSVILDLGGGTTTATVIHENKIKYATIDLEGGEDVTKDISVVLGTSKKDAEQIKLDYGSADPELTSSEDKFSVKTVGKSEQETVDENYLSQIIAARMDQILGRIGKGLASHDAFKLPGGVVITGGMTLLQGLQSAVEKHFEVKTRVYQPDEMGLRNPAYAAAYGVVNYVYNLNDIDLLVNGVIYGTSASHENPLAEFSENSINIFKRHAEVSENNTKEAYNDTIAPRVDREKDGANKSENSKKGIRGFFKNFFD
ncbi:MULTISPECIES: cell division protein FtsA [Lactobacillus]|uniref:Cell division protein FtsA n=1 Tax=Lactobacillus mulieris TaxID=2508708 RepID=A0AAP3M3P9_9LACO|nr:MULTISPECIES: cell division protein FtsA [Lactobacillus]EEU21182.1 cell division protein FtsA [Lactobacillus jensenii 27-2-CHN]EEX24059.1 cell division protein FtsA [Lactobacillus jensenii 115-3-CHN]EFH29236.1 cell division protein FtsA [Lactobacillus jensenii JV-V16]KAA9245375.1 cell division protein FtsA [Lactobacillus jensenii]KAA9368444.1 cell division protein FtsA [Lactobacillus jensenii]